MFKMQRILFKCNESLSLSSRVVLPRYFRVRSIYNSINNYCCNPERKYTTSIIFKGIPV